MNIRHTPNTVAEPFGPYSHAVEVPEGSPLQCAGPRMPGAEIVAVLAIGERT
jgi:hypothetical protein